MGPADAAGWRRAWARLPTVGGPPPPAPARDRDTSSKLARRSGGTPRGDVERVSLAATTDDGLDPPEFTVGHRSSDTLLYRLVEQHLPAFLAHVEENYDKPLPRYVRNELDGYLRCGVLAHGFKLSKCDWCPIRRLIPFSCKCRGICPSCGARRMNDLAAQLVERVLPDVPLRQWVLTLPWRLRKLAAMKSDVLTAVVRIFCEEVFRALRAAARAAGVEGRLECGAVTLVQRFGSMNLNVHLHVLVLDGLFTLADGAERAEFHAGGRPDRATLDDVARRCERRMKRWLRRHGYTPGEDSGDACDDMADEPTALDACTDAGIARGKFVSLAANDTGVKYEDDDADFDHRRRDSRAGESGGFNIHADVSVKAGDRPGRERLCRYACRQAVSLERLTQLPDGRIAYRLKHSRRGGNSHRVMTPVEFIARLVSLVPPPRFPLLRYHGVVAPNSKWRSAVVPATVRSIDGRLRCCAAHATVDPATPANSDGATRGVHPTSTTTPTTAISEPQSNTAATTVASPTDSHAAPTAGALASHRAGTTPTARGGRLRSPGGERLSWATLLLHTFGEVVGRCRCGGPMRVTGAVTDPGAIRRILDAAGEPSEPPNARPREYLDIEPPES